MQQVSFSPNTARALRQVLARTQAHSRVPSISAGLGRPGYEPWLAAVGTLDARRDGPSPTCDTQYRIGSISKTFTAALVLGLRDRGALALDDRLGDLFGSVPLDAPIARLTVAQLLSHTSGLAAETLGPWWERTAGGDFRSLLPSLRLVHRPGERYHYSNVGFGVLGALVEELLRQPWQQVVTEQLTTPLGMSRTTFHPNGNSAPGLGVHPRADLLQPEPSHDAAAMAPAGQLWSTPTDLLRWADVLRTGGGVLAESTAHELRRPIALHDDRGEAWTAAHGLGVEVTNLAGRRFVGHGGSMPGFLAYLCADVETGDSVVVFVNATSGVRIGALAQELLATVRQLEPAQPPTWYADSNQLPQAELVGEWYWGTAVHHLHARPEGRLELVVPGPGRPDRFDPVGPDLWRGLDGYFAGELLRVVRAPGSARVSHLDIASFRFSRTPYDPDADIPGGTQAWS